MESLNIKRLTRMALLILGIVVVQSYGIADPNNVEFESENFSDNDDEGAEADDEQDNNNQEDDLSEDENADMQDYDEDAEADDEQDNNQEDLSEDENTDTQDYDEDAEADNEFQDSNSDNDTQRANCSDGESDITSNEDDFIYRCPVGHRPNGVNYE